jgi:hypothetical protein
MKFGLNRSQVLILAVIAFAIWVPYFSGAKRDIEHQRKGCERQNVIRFELHKLVSEIVEDSDRLQAEAKDKAESNYIRLQIEKYIETRDNLYASTRDYPAGKDSVNIDCEAAYPYPFPLSLTQ